MPSLKEKLERYLVENAKIPLDQRVFFTENLRVMIHAGLSMSEALNTLSLQSESKTFRKIITEVKENVESGKSLSFGLSKFPRTFAPIFISMVQVGEVSGTLEENLQELTTQMKKDYELRSKVKGAMTYPAVILVAMLGITTGLIVFVLPKLLDVFKEFGDVQLPLPTRILMSVSDFVQANGILVAIGAAILVILFIAFARTKRGGKILDAAILKSPIIGPIAKKVNLARFSRTVSALLKTDIPVVQAFTITSDVLSNIHYRTAILEAGEKIKKGETISQVLGRHPKLFPPLVVQMVYVGERSGTVDSLLADIANFYEQQVDNVLDNLSSIIEPILILTLGFMVGGIALAVITPIYALTQSIAES
ncbi:type II secretion system F family protein [Candidatus Uhrbacteria bacterium]|nr:type II secretion system F family protein [Candidatus Uhrbacteria bacterium]